MPGWGENDKPISGGGYGEDLPDFSGAESGASFEPRKAPISARDQAFIYSVPPVDPRTPEGQLALAVSTLPIGGALPSVGRFLASPAGGAIVGGGTKALQGGDIGDVAKAAAIGGGLGYGGSGIAKKLLPFLLKLKTAAPAAVESVEAAVPAVAESVEAGAGSLALRLKQIAEQSGANRAAVKELIKSADPRQFGYDTIEELSKFIFTPRTRL